MQRGDELPEQLRTAEGRRAALAEAKRRIEERKGRAVGEEETSAEVEVDPSWCSVGVGVAAGGVSGLGSRAASSKPRGSARRGRSRAIGRTACSRRSVGWRRTTGSSWPPTTPTSAGARRQRDTLGRVLKGNSKPFVAPELPEGKINLSDPDSRVMRTQGTPPRQAYNAQTAVNEQQIILAAEITDRRAGLRAPRADARHHARAPRAARGDRAARGGAR